MKHNSTYFSNLIESYRLIVLVIICVPFLCSCDRSSRSSKELLKVLDMTLKVEMIDTVRQRGVSLPWSDFRQKFRSISVVYLQDGCGFCYSKFEEWHIRLERILTAYDYTVLFIIVARDYNSFSRNIRLHEEIDERYYYFIDPRNGFFRYNSDISHPVLERSLLIDSDNRIKMVGEPFANADMTKLFHIVTGQKGIWTGMCCKTCFVMGG